nr:MAG TPA_asm: hypothetical protein [Caudoviricetes sp.]
MIQEKVSPQISSGISGGLTHKDVILKQNCLRSTLFNRRIFCLE